MPTFTTDDGVAISANDLGGNGPDLLLAHATGFHGMVFKPLVANLRRQFHCYVFDERGHGDSGSAPNDDCDWNGFALDALAVVEGFGLRRPFGFGHSCGGALLVLAEESRPGTFAGLYLFEPIIRPTDGPGEAAPDNPLAEGARRRREVFASRDEALANYASKPPLDALDATAMRAYVDHGFEDLPDGTVRLKCRGADEARIYSMGMAHDAYRHLATISCPVTLACGADTTAIGPPTLQALAAPLPDAKVEVFDAMSHFGPLEDPGRVAASVLTALADG